MMTQFPCSLQSVTGASHADDGEIIRTPPSTPSEDQRYEIFLTWAYRTG